MTSLTFNEVKEKNVDKLAQFTPIVLRVHGEHHPEMNEVNNLFKEIQEKIKITKEKPNLDKEFIELRNVTQNYEIPNDVCESYEAVYHMLKELDQAYHA